MDTSDFKTVNTQKLKDTEVRVELIALSIPDSSAELCRKVCNSYNLDTVFLKVA